MFVVQLLLISLSGVSVSIQKMKHGNRQGLTDIFFSNIFVTDAFSYGDDREGKTFIGNRNFFLSDMEDDRTGGTYSIWLFHFAFAATSGKFQSNRKVFHSFK